MNAQKTGEFIKALRKEKSLTQKELAEKLNCTDKAISRWETGRGIPEISFLLPLSETLDVSVNEILLGERFEKEQIIEKTDRLIIDTIKDNNKKSTNLKIFIFALICFLQFFITYVVPLTASPGDEMGIVFFLFLGTLTASFILGLTPMKLKTKFLFSLIVLILFVPSVFLLPIYVVDFEIFAMYIPILLILTFLGIFVGTGINKLIRQLINIIKTTK